MTENEELGPTAVRVYRLGFSRREVEHDPAENLILLQNLVRIKSLGQTQCAQLHGFRNNRHVGADFFGWITDVVRDALYQNGHVIQQLFGWKYSVFVDA